MFKVILDNEDPHITLERLDEQFYCHELDSEDVMDKPRFHEVQRNLKAQEYPEGTSVNDKKFQRRFSTKFFLSNGTLYKSKHYSILLWCVDKRKVERIMEDLHKGTFGTHSNGHTMAKKILRAGCY